LEESFQKKGQSLGQNVFFKNVTGGNVGKVKKERPVSGFRRPLVFIRGNPEAWSALDSWKVEVKAEAQSGVASVVR